MRGGGFMTSSQYFNPNETQPTAGLFSGGAALSTNATPYAIRPELRATYGGGRRRTRHRQRFPPHRGGFSPSVMGGFIPNAQAAVVPAALYLAYHTMVPKGARGRSALKSLSRKAGRFFKRFTRSRK